jgi:hypothetical protein
MGEAALFSGIRRPGRAAVNSPPTIAEVRKALHGVVLKYLSIRTLVTPYRHADGYRNFGGTCYIHFQGWSKKDYV